MGFKIKFPGNKRVNAEMNGFTIETDQSPRAGGDGSAPEPFSLFLASIGTCSGIYVKSFCDSRGISAEGIELEQNISYDPVKRKIGEISIDIQVPEDFPNKYYSALERAVNQCAVKKTIQDPPEFSVKTTAVK